MGGDFNAATIYIELSALAFFVVCRRQWDRGFRALLRSWGLLFHDLRFTDRLAGFVYPFLGDKRRIAVELGIGKEPRSTSGVIQDVKKQFAVVVPHARPAPDDLLELAHRIHGSHEHDILAGLNVHAGREHLGRGDDDRRLLFQFHEAAQIAATNVALIRNHAHDVIGMLLGEVAVAVIDRLAHFLGVLLVHAENDGLRKAISFLHEVRDVAGDGKRTRLKRDEPLEIRRAIDAVRDLAAVAVELSGRRAPACRIDRGDDPVYAVRCKKSVVNALPEAVSVNGILEISVGVPVVLPERRRGHPDLVGVLEVFQDLAPVALIAGAAPMAFVHEDEVEEIPRVFPIEPWPIGVAGQPLVDGKVHLAAFYRFPLDLVARLTEGREHLCLRLIHQDIAVRQIQDSWPPVFPRLVPPGIPELPTDLKGDERLPGARRQREKDPLPALEYGLHGPVDRNLLVVPRRLARNVAIGGKQRPSNLIGNRLRAAKPRPEILGTWKASELLFPTCQEVMLGYAVTVRCISKLEP